MNAGDEEQSVPPESDGEDGNDMLQELRILLQGTQVLTAFLIVLPCSEGFGKIQQTENDVSTATSFRSVLRLILFSALKSPELNGSSLYPPSSPC